MKELSIIFGSEMIKAILDGRKTQTRRVINFPIGFSGADIIVKSEYQGKDIWDVQNPRELGVYKIIPKYQIGDRLWVKEGWRCTGGGTTRNIIYRVDGDSPMSFCGVDDGRKAILHVPKEYWEKWDYYVYDSKIGCNWRSGRFMPKWASRIWLEVTDVRVERLQDINEKDAITEGIDRNLLPYDANDVDKAYLYDGTAIELFKTLWNSINAKRGYGWDTNLSVCVYEFIKL